MPSVSPTCSPSPERAARCLALTAALAACACSSAPRDAGPERAETPADQVLRGGTMVTMDPERPLAEAVAIRDGRIVAVGTEAEVAPFIGKDTYVTNVGGRTVTPGLVDAHAHLAGLGAQLERVSLRGSASEQEAARRVSREAVRLEVGEWVLGRGWDQTLWHPPEFPTRATLDAVVTQQPVAVRRVDGHAVWVNSVALELAGIDRDTPDPAGGRIVRDAAGEPTGVLIDNAISLVESKIPAPSPAAIERRIMSAARYAVARGLTGVHEMGLDAATIAVYQRLAPRLPIRVYGFVGGDAADIDELIARDQILNPNGMARFTLRGVKLYADGALGSRGAALREPYTDDPDNSGLPVTAPDVLADAVEVGVAAGWQIAVHAIGDRAIHDVLDAYERAGGAGVADLRLRVEHVQTLAPDDAPRFAALGVIASMQPTHCTSDMRWAEARVGPERARGLYAWRTLLDSGAHVAFGSDFPVEEVDPLLGLYAAVTRQDAAGEPEGGWYPNQRVSLDEALAGFTIGAAYASFSERNHGRLVVGQVADMTIFDRPLAPDSSLLRNGVHMTIVGGQAVHPTRE